MMDLSTGSKPNTIIGGALIMKLSKSTDKINGLNEFPQLVVGIDMAKETHVAHATNFRGIVVAKRHLTLKNAREGYEKLQRWMDELQQKHRRRPSSSGWNPQDTIGGTWRIGLQTKALIQ
jgi:hypothetical protein